MSRDNISNIIRPNKIYYRHLLVVLVVELQAATRTGGLSARTGRIYTRTGSLTAVNACSAAYSDQLTYIVGALGILVSRDNISNIIRPNKIYYRYLLVVLVVELQAATRTGGLSARTGRIYTRTGSSTAVNACSAVYSDQLTYIVGALGILVSRDNISNIIRPNKIYYRRLLVVLAVELQAATRTGGLGARTGRIYARTGSSTAANACSAAYSDQLTYIVGALGILVSRDNISNIIRPNKIYYRCLLVVLVVELQAAARTSGLGARTGA